MKKFLRISLGLGLCMLLTMNLLAQLPLVTVRFANPQYNCSTQTYCLDVEFQSNTPDKQLYGMNVRFFYDDVILEYLSMGNFVDGYTQTSPNPPVITTGGATSGALLFDFPSGHPFEFVNGAIQLTGTSSLTLSTTGWTRIFTICFNVDDPASLDTNSFCPSVIWDLEYNPANGGWLAGDDGVVMTVVAPPPVFSSEANEATVHMNWAFDATPEVRPYGNPVPATCISTQGILATASATDASCYGGNDGTATATPTNGTGPFTYLWSNGATTATATGLAAGTYDVTVTDNNVCNAYTSATVGQPDQLLPGTAGADQAICANSAPSPLSATAPTGEAGSYSYLWQYSTDGSAYSDISGATDLSYTPGNLAVTTWFRVKQTATGCGSFVFTNPVVITVVQPIQATVNPDQYLCNQFTTFLAGNWPATGNSGSWTFISGPNTPSYGPANSPVVGVSGLTGSSTPYIFKYTHVTNASGISCPSEALSYIYNYAYPSAAYAGPDQELCLSPGPTTSADLAASIPTSGQGKWSQYSGPTTALFSDPFNPAASVSNLAEGTYTFFWRVGNGVCDSTQDAVHVTIHAPAYIYAGPDTLICGDGSLELTQAVAVGCTTYAWSTSGSGSFNNVHALHPVYTPSPADVAAGSVVLTLTTLNCCSPCPAASSSLILSFQPAPVADAGDDATICETSANYVCNASAANYSGFYWETLGTGVFNDIFILDPVYIPSADDIAAGCVYLVLHVQGELPCGATSDTMKLCINKVPIAFAGPDDLICQGSSYLLSLASAQHAAQITWSTSGTGTFSDIHAQNPTYFLSSDDIAAGNVTLTMDVLGMSPCPNTSDEMILNIHPAPSVSIDVLANVSCYGLSDGSLQALATGGTAPYTYLWSTGATTDMITALPAGDYSVTVTDSFGCTAESSATITQPLELWLSGLAFDALCYGSSDGEIYPLVYGGTEPYAYAWSNGATTSTLIGLAAGDYTLTLTDAHSCTISQTFTVGQPDAILATETISPATCNATATGAIELDVTGGTTPYLFNWSNGQTTASISGLLAGDYTVTITDAHSCELVETYTVTEPSAQSLSGVVTDVSCHGGDNGAIDISNAGGTPPYTYSWSTGATTQDISGLVAGVYAVTVSDANSCDISDSWTVGQPDALALSADITHIICYGYTDGSIDLSVTGGTAPFTYLWSNTATTEDLSDLVAGTYSVTVTDALLCQITGSYTVNEPPFWAIDITGPQLTCENSSGNQYCAVVDDPSHPGELYSYEWTVTGGIITSGDNSQCITVTWLPCTNGSVTLVVTRLSDGCILTKTIGVQVIAAPAPIVTGPIQVNAGDTAQYCTPYLPGHLYSWSIIGGTIISGQGTNCITIVWGPYPACGCGQVTVTETFNGCNGTFTLPITLTPGGSVSIAGYVVYDNDELTPLNGVTVELRNASNYIVGTAITQNNLANGQPGYYAFTGLTPGSYTLRGSYNGPWGGNNATDALIIQMNVLGTFPLAYLRDTVANVNGSVAPRVSALDALYVKLRTVGSINSYPAGDWKVGDTTVAFAGSALNVNLKALCVGDVNGSHVPGALKQAPGLNILQQGIIAARVDEPFIYEVKSHTAAEPGAMTLFLNFDDKLFEVIEVVSDLQELKYTIENGRIALAWADTRPLNLDANQTIFSFTVRAKAQISQPQAIFTIAQGSEFADVNANPISEFDLRMADVFTPAISGEISLMNYPNPFKNNTQVVFTIPEQGHVKLVMTNLFGQQIRTLAEGNMTAGTHSVMVDPSDNNLPSGVYLCKIILTNYDQTQSKVVKMLYNK